MTSTAFATGKFAIGECERCGFVYPLHELKKEWNGLMVCLEECYEEKHPQLLPLHSANDPEALRDSRPARVEPQEIYVGGPGATAKFFNNPRKPLNIAADIGKVTVTIS